MEDLKIQKNGDSFPYEFWNWSKEIKTIKFYWRIRKSKNLQIKNILFSKIYSKVKFSQVFLILKRMVMTFPKKSNLNQNAK